MTKVSILLTSYNHGKFIKKTIDSILNQTFKDYELIIIDDCSTDNSWEIISSYNDKRIKKIRHEKNISYCTTRKLVESFKGKYFALAHSDDVWNKDKLKKQVEYLDCHEKTVACFSWVKLINEEDKELNSTSYTNFNVSFKDRFDMLNHFFYNGNCLCHPSILIRRNVMLEENLFVIGLGALADFYKWVKLSLKYDIYIYPEKLTYFRVKLNGTNSSGYNKNNITRVHFDIIPILELYTLIEDKKDFLKVFPSAEKYVINGDIELLFVFARICIDEIATEPYKLFGMKLIYDLLQNPDKLKKIEKLYNYTVKEFKVETGSNDVFKVIKDRDFINFSITFGENESTVNEKLEKSIFVKDEKFIVLFDELNLDVKKLEINLDKNYFRKYKNIEIHLNGDKIKKFSCNGYKLNKWIYFFTIKPKILVHCNKKIEKISISGTTKLISKEEIEDKIKNRFLLSKIKKRICYIYLKLTRKE